MVDFTGKYWKLEDLDPDFVQKFVNVELYKHYEGCFVKNAYDPKFTINGKYDETAANKAEDLNITMCVRMKQDGIAFKVEKHTHNYPHCWRTDKPILYYPLDSWFIRSTACKERMVELNKSINWKPEHTGNSLNDEEWHHRRGYGYATGLRRWPDS